MAEQLKWRPAEALPPVVAPTPQPTRITVPARPSLYTAAVGGRTELRLPADTQGVEVGDVVHLVERGDDEQPTGRCCYRLVTRKLRPVGDVVPVTVLSATGQCEGKH